MLYYLSGVERSFYKRTIRVSILFLFIGLLLGFAGGYTYRVILDDKDEHGKIRQELKEQRGRIVGLEGAWGVRQGKEKKKLYGEEGKRK